MSTTVAIAVVMLVLAATNVWVHVGSDRAQLVTGPLAALLLLFVGRWAGLTWQELGLGRESLPAGAQLGVEMAVIVAIVYAVGVALPSTRGAFRDTRYRLGLRAALFLALVAIPLGTVLFEEVAFRGVLWGLLVRDFGVITATAVSAGIFGLWHILPALALVRTHTSVPGHDGAEGRRGSAENRRGGAGLRPDAVTVLATVVFTTIAGVVFVELRLHSGSLLAPIGLHWATNGLGVVAAACVWATTPGATTGGSARHRPPLF